jgi:hypothetical protein
MALPETVEKWNTCVQQAKKKHNIKTTWGYLGKAALKDAQRCYCAMSFLRVR